MFGRPFGACSDLFAAPTVETVGYFHSPLAGLADRILSVKQRDAEADLSACDAQAFLTIRT